MIKRKLCVFNQDCKNQEMNKVSKALKDFEKAKYNLEKAKIRYAECSCNYSSKIWEFTDYDKLFDKIFEKSDLTKNKYNDLKVFENIINLEDKYFILFSVSKDVFEYFEPKTINDLTKIFAIGNIVEYLFEKIKNSAEVPNFIKPIVKNTNNQIIFQEQMQNILLKIFKNKKETQELMKHFQRLRIKLHSILTFERGIKDTQFSILENIKKHYFDIYTEYLKIPYSVIINKLSEQNVSEDDGNKIFDMLLLGSFYACRRKKALKCAKYLYLISESKLKNIPVEIKGIEID